MTLLEGLQIAGTIVAFVLAGIKIYEFWKGSIKIQMMQRRCEYHIVDENPRSGTPAQLKFFIEIDVNNKGGRATTISHASFYVPFLQRFDALSYVEIYNHGFTFEPIRLEANDRRTINLHASVNIPSERIDKLRKHVLYCTLHLQASHKDFDIPVNVQDKALFG